jgi:hypothetical protein
VSSRRRRDTRDIAARMRKRASACGVQSARAAAAGCGTPRLKTRESDAMFGNEMLMRIRLTVFAGATLALAASLPLAGCAAAGGSGGEGGALLLSKDGECKEVVHALCAALATCQGAGASASACEAAVDCNEVESVARDWQQCVDDLGGASCATLTQGAPPSCDQVLTFPGTPSAAYELSFSQGTSGSCEVLEHSSSAGLVTASATGEVVVDGQGGASVACSVTGQGPFAVSGTVMYDAASVVLSVPSIDATATMAAPAQGTVSYGGPDTEGVPFSSASCAFWLEGPESIAAGKAWLSFACPAVTHGENTCAIDSGVVLLENCARK